MLKKHHSFLVKIQLFCFATSAMVLITLSFACSERGDVLEQSIGFETMSMVEVGHISVGPIWSTDGSQISLIRENDSLINIDPVNNLISQYQSSQHKLKDARWHQFKWPTSGELLVAYSAIPPGLSARRIAKLSEDGDLLSDAYIDHTIVEFRTSDKSLFVATTSPALSGSFYPYVVKQMVKESLDPTDDISYVDDQWRVVHIACSLDDDTYVLVLHKRGMILDTYKLVLVRASDAMRKTLFETRRRISRPSFSGDGAELVVAIGNKLNTPNVEVRIINIESQTSYSLENVPSYISTVDWHPTQNLLLLEAYRRPSNRSLHIIKPQTDVPTEQ